MAESLEKFSYSNKIDLVSPDDLKPYLRNARTHSDEQVNQIARSMREFGFTNPILVDANDVIIAGHGRLMAAKELGMFQVPVIRLGHLTDAQRRALVIADNKLALNAGWDDKALASELAALRSESYDLDVIGFSDDELAALLDPEELPPGGAEEVPEPRPDPKVVLGEIYILGNHRLMCGDSVSIDDVDRLMEGAKIDMVFTDPPYGMSAVSKSGVLSKNYASDILNDDNVDVAKDAYRLCAGMGIPKLVFWGANYYSSALPDATCWLVWDKNNGQSDQMDCELAWTNLKGVTRQFTKASEKTNRVHPTQKPVDLITWCFDRYDAGDVMDLFGGSGSTLIAAEQTRRRSFIMELDPIYCGVILDRWEKFTGKEAIRSDGVSWKEIRGE